MVISRTEVGPHNLLWKKKHSTDSQILYESIKNEIKMIKMTNFQITYMRSSEAVMY